MAMFGATLTLPGMAGIVLTIGMAVDANVIITERLFTEISSQSRIFPKKQLKSANKLAPQIQIRLDADRRHLTFILANGYNY